MQKVPVGQDTAHGAKPATGPARTSPSRGTCTPGPVGRRPCRSCETQDSERSARTGRLLGRPAGAVEGPVRGCRWPGRSWSRRRRPATSPTAAARLAAWRPAGAVVADTSVRRSASGCRRPRRTWPTAQDTEVSAAGLAGPGRRCSSRCRSSSRRSRPARPPCRTSPTRRRLAQPATPGDRSPGRPAYRSGFGTPR